MSIKELTSTLKQTYTKWSDHEAPRLGASIAFYSVLSFAPLLLLTTAVIALIFGQSSAQGTLVNEARQLIGDRGAATVESLLKNAQKPASGVFASLIAFVTLLYGASGVFSELQAALNIMWDAPAQTSAGFLGVVKQRLLSFGMVLSIGFLLLVSLLLSAGLAFIGKAFGQIVPLPTPIMEALNFLVSFLVISVLFALMFKYVPNAKVPWNVGLVGGIGTALLFTIGKFLLGLYLGKASVGSTYGAAGSLVAVIVWIYYSAQIFFFGAEFTHVYSETQILQASVPNEQTVDRKVERQPETSEPPAAVLSRPPEAALVAAVPIQSPIGKRMESHLYVPYVATNVKDSGPNGSIRPKLLWALGIGVVLGRLFTSAAHAKNRANT